MMADLVGASVGSYTITERVGRGGMAEVYKALHTGLSVHRALKVIRPEFVTADDFRARFQKEAQAVAQLRHPNIVQVHDFGTHAGAYYMVMEFIEGRDLKRILQEEGPIRPISRAVDIVVRIANALEYAHARGLIHRDIKPENVMMTANGEPILTDFGIAKLVTSNTHLTQTGFGIGTPAYMAPEQAQGLTDVGPAADIYALTVVLFELLTGRVPFSADTPIAVIMKSMSDPLPLPRTLKADISEALQAVVIKGTQKRPEDRYATIGALRDALIDATASTTARATVVRRVPGKAVDDATTVMARRPSSKLLARGGMAAAAILAAAGVGYWFTTREQAAIEPPPVASTRDAPATPLEPQSAAATTSGGAIVVDKTVTARASRPGEQIEYTFDAQAGDTVFFDRADESQPTDFALIAPGGARLFDTSADEGPLALPGSGQYRLVARPRGDAAAAFEFTMRSLETPVLDAGEMKPNQRVEGRTRAPGQVAQYRIALREGQTVRLSVDRASEPTDFRLIDPDSRELFATDEDTGEIVVSASGVHTLTVDPRFDRAADYAFALRSPMQQKAAPPALAAEPAPAASNPPGLNPRTAKLLKEAMDAQEAGELSVAKETLAKLNPERLSPYARSRVAQLKASIAYEEKDYDGFRKHLEAAVRSGGLDAEEVSQAQFQIAQSHVLQEHWQDAATALEKWFATAKAPGASAYYLLGVCRYQLGDIDAALPPTQKAVDLTRAPETSWLELLLALRLEKEDYAAAAPLLERLIAKHPDRDTYKTQLASVKSSLDPARTPVTTAAAAPAAAPPPTASTSLVSPGNQAAQGTANQVMKGVTTQRDLLRMFGGPNITTFNEAGLETWVYERTATQTDTTSTSQSVSGGVDFNLFFDVGNANLGASASKGTSRESASARSTIRSVTVIVTFAPDRTVADYTVRESYF